MIENEKKENTTKKLIPLYIASYSPRVVVSHMLCDFFSTALSIGGQRYSMPVLVAVLTISWHMDYE